MRNGVWSYAKDQELLLTQKNKCSIMKAITATPKEGPTVDTSYPDSIDLEIQKNLTQLNLSSKRCLLDFVCAINDTIQEEPVVFVQGSSLLQDA